MTSEIIGQCFVCGAPITKHLLSFREEGESYPKAVYVNGWPKSGLACTKHPGIIEEYENILNSAGKSLNGVLGVNIASTS